jgi:hypothetical protein
LSQSPVHRTSEHTAVPWQDSRDSGNAKISSIQLNKNNSGKQTRLVRSKSKNGNTKRTCQETTTPSAYGEPDVFKVLTHECRRPLITHRHKDPPSARQALGLSKWAREMGDQGDSCAARPRFLVREEAECTPARVSTQLKASPRDDSLWMSFSIGRPGSFEQDAGRLLTPRECHAPVLIYNAHRSEKTLTSDFAGRL